MNTKKILIISAASIITVAAGILALKNLNLTKEEPSAEKIADSIDEPLSNIESDNKKEIFEEYKPQAEEKLKSLSTEEKAGQIFLARCPDSEAVETVKNYHPGGYILFANDFSNKSASQVKNTITSYQSSSKIPMIIGVDEEGGTVVRVSSNPALSQQKFQSPQTVFNQGGYTALTEDAKNKSKVLKSLGINLNLAPVCDVSTNSNDYIYARSFGKSAEETSLFVSAVVSGMKDENMNCTLKHFPGYGNNKNTHTGISIDERPYDHFINSDFKPFKAGIDSGAESILVSHNIVKSMDGDRPASLSPKVHEILRNDLNFSGIIMTDDLAMDAITQYSSGKNPAVEAFNAGNDMLIISDFKNGYRAILDAVNSGEIPIEKLDSAVLRILEWKYYSGLLK